MLIQLPGLLERSTKQGEVTSRSMFDSEAETLTYQPISFLVQMSTNPDSPRDFKDNKDNNKNNNSEKIKKKDINNSSSGRVIRRQNVINRKKPRQSLMDYLPSSISGKRNGGRLPLDVRVRSNSYHSPGIVRSQTIQGVEGEFHTYSKPITVRLKFQEKRRLTLDSKPSSPRQPTTPTSSSKVPLSRSKSDVGTYVCVPELTREEMQKKCRALLRARLSGVMDVGSSCDSFSEADSCLGSSASSFYELFPNDKRYQQYSSSPTSGFGDESEENEALSFSRSSSVFIPVARTTVRPKSMEMAGFNYHKDSETRIYSKSLEKSRRPSSIVRSQSFGRQTTEETTKVEWVHGGITFNDDDDAIPSDGDSESDDVKENNDNGICKSFSPKITAMVRERKQKRLSSISKNNVLEKVSILSDIYNTDVATMDNVITSDDVSLITPKRTYVDVVKHEPITRDHGKSYLEHTSKRTQGKKVICRRKVDHSYPGVGNLKTIRIESVL